ncbi:hypothetical protein A3D05_02830 [Candidatus Gottesmanbacteria bacterium RIFCSPHIGHO2_02_FULL_40_24]|uniref:Glycosyltransferase RgtA/B/C/D-like domain-containing protein n=1 Tax=Candidatus Gottesmanbacteria bacterium RIFCSPHIGHO2_01_FULL_40_15 TaxID=1798376 RepID=A0A1F5Z7E6_9BACT|nr:MAG: hypothetical protein A2777_06340 [Candidatus Gottesmanbacteria bacterium RIFCSPHIGHO2_01_FULL_40_15]OGG18121.1 MAG: hypothetical protein A3D05_02830 [Candidatus Gottesmanbacteria bacterium RIFCSPHIGHO2_02_FULL_40_24]OGG21041.1 MAG: hypothetical protein A3B48_03820 [Candidatus Gottesmanbacteria bacterium RIFCSPLOWO2_01_FULL_40_10]OGG25064.1 MAG: hypothetical protein A3E42_05215 [Candidatus Gottesmanbacteria bacterium RIFCSPHIGHO2_12_FULL_40_13]OGG33893.1 MAG: hypothetical protein A3I80_0
MISSLWKFVIFFSSNLLPYITIFLLSLFMPGDTDLGWHLRYGEFFFKTGKIVRENIFSLEMPGYKWVNSSWLTDLITYPVYNTGSFLGLSILGAITVVLTFYIFSKVLKLSFWEKAFIFPVLYFLEYPLIKISFRGQLISLLFTAIIIYLLSQYRRGKTKTVFFLVPLFLLWANLHGGFLLGLIICLMYFTIRQIKNFTAKKGFADKNLAAAIFISIPATLINPWGIGIYSEIIRHFGNPYQKYIVEWIPLSPFSDLWWVLIFWGIFIIINVSLIVDREKFSHVSEWVFITVIMYFLSHWMRRYAWTMYPVSLPVAGFLFKDIKPDRRKSVLRFLPYLIFIIIYFAAVKIHIPGQKLTKMNWSRFCNEFIKCSPESAEFLLNNKPPGKFLSFYNWGGYLIWNYPEIVPSVDGRMHLWQDKTGYSAFSKYYLLEQDIRNIDNSDYDTVYISTEKPLYRRLTTLSDRGQWTRVYEDESAAVFTRNK